MTPPTRAPETSLSSSMARLATGEKGSIGCHARRGSTAGSVHTCTPSCPPVHIFQESILSVLLLLFLGDEQERGWVGEGKGSRRRESDFQHEAIHEELRERGKKKKKTKRV